MPILYQCPRWTPHQIFGTIRALALILTQYSPQHILYVGVIHECTLIVLRHNTENRLAI